MSWKPFITRLAAFLILLFMIVPIAVYRIGTKPQMTISVLYIPIMFAGMLTVFILLKKEELKTFEYTFNWKQTTLFGILAYSFFLAYIIQQRQYWTSGLAHMLTGQALYATGGLLLLLAVFNTKFVKEHIKQIVLSLVIIVLYGAGSTALSLAGYPLTRILAKPLTALLSLTNNATFTVNQAPTLTADSFTATIGPPCTGITSLILFTGLFAFLILLDWKKINKKAILWVYIIGATGMLLVAFLRLYLLFYIGANWSQEFALKGFHSNASWILFIAYFFAYLWITYPKLVSKV
ncbi:MAG: exosortase/archaeosortase family protein [Candidatus Woesearchaeota archaeon]|nr:exosortase/archaeosortase family protein [Candidatus Woesearchaeota archaeon]